MPHTKKETIGSLANLRHSATKQRTQAAAGLQRPGKATIRQHFPSQRNADAFFAADRPTFPSWTGL